MLYNSSPPFEHHSHLTFAYEPLKSLYVFQRLFTTILLVPCWWIYYFVLPRSYRPRPSWSLKQIIFVNFTRRISKVTEVAGMTWGTRNPEEEAKDGDLNETRFEWIESLPEDLRHGIVVSEGDRVPFKRVGAFIWPKEAPQSPIGGSATPSPQIPHFDFESTSAAPRDIEASAADASIIGIFMHGGGYTHMSAHENARTSRIPRTLLKVGKLYTLIIRAYLAIRRNCARKSILLNTDCSSSRRSPL